MNRKDYNCTFVVPNTPQEVFKAINNVRGWWSEDIEGSTEKLQDEFAYRYEDMHRCLIQLIEVVPDEKVVWEVLDNYFAFTTDQTEWKGTTISFEISAKGDKTELRFTHHGLTPAYECFDMCSDAWTDFLRNSLMKLVTSGKGRPNKKEDQDLKHASDARTANS